MGRFLDRRIIVEGDLVVERALHVGGSEMELFADMMLARNGAGEIYLPATSLAGPMRAWWERAFLVDREDNNVWGPARDKVKDKGAASLIRVEDAPLADGNYSEIRDHVGIDRCSSTAAEGIKFDREIVPEGSKFSFRLILEIPHKQDNPEQLESRLGALLKALQAGDIRFGGAKTSGLGKVKLEQGKAVIEEPGNKNKLLEWLKKRPSPDADTFSELVKKAETTAPSHLLTITIHWKSVLPVMMKDGRQGFNINMIPLTTGKGDVVKMVLPGSGIKGVIRAHSERIVRTLQGEGEWDGKASCFDDKALIPDDIIKRLYGAKGERKKKAEYGISAVYVDDCFPKQSCMNRKLRERLLTDKAGEDKDKTRDVMTALTENSAQNSFHPSQHNAIDRWTGGTADSALYSVLEPNLTTGTIDLTVDLCRIKGSDSEKKAALALLLITLRDFKSGLLPIGFGANRGLGAIEVKSIDFKMDESDGWPYLNGELETLLVDELEEGWSAFIESLANKEQAA